MQLEFNNLEKEFIDIKVLSKITGYAESSLYNMVYRGDIPYFKKKRRRGGRCSLYFDLDEMKLFFKID
jgi:predicted DNA-binding transcriptional regulator AlpA